ncbi:hypothetical protein NXY01_14615 [Bacteroides fragilis]|nr:hypothetical protein NXY01_14615 [Bacteroides fragilis]
MTYPIKYNKSLVSLEGMRRPKELIIKTPKAFCTFYNYYRSPRVEIHIVIDTIR